MSDAAANHTPAVSDTPEYRGSLFDGPQKLALTVGVVGLVVYLVLWGLYAAAAPGEIAKHEASPIQQLFLSYLSAFMFWILVGFGSVFFLLIQYVTGGRWGILLRRPLEANSKTLVLGAILFIPVAITMLSGEKSVYWWARHAAHMSHGAEGATHKKDDHPGDAKTLSNVRPDTNVDEEKKIKEWLSPGFTVFRGLLWIGLFIGLAFWMWGNARTAEYDDNLDAARAARNRQKYVGAFGLFIFAITMTMVATDWVMSLEETFASSMFPVIMFDNAAVISYSIGLLTLLYVKSKGDPRFSNLFPATEQIHLGSLLLAFTLAWTYFNFSQYMLIWIGNLPEEIPYYLKRTRGGWGWYAGLAVLFHFPIPFLLLLFRRVKSNPTVLRNVCLMLLAVVFFDVMWWISPSMSHNGMLPVYWIMDLAAWVGLGGVWVWWFLNQLKKHPLLPTREVYLLEAYHHGH